MMASIDTLPDEIILNIFHVHVNYNADTPQRLLRVCKRWYSIAIDSAILWCDIACTNIKFIQPEDILTSERLQIVDPLENKVICSSADAFIAVIERTKSQPFQLTLAFPWKSQSKAFDDWANVISLEQWRLIIEALSQRCLSLTLFDCAENPIHITSFEALEHLQVHGKPSFDLVYILGVVESTSSNIRHMVVERERDAGDIVLQYPGIVSRLRSLTVDTIDPIQMDYSFPNAPELQELQLLYDGPRPQYISLGLAMPNLRSLWLSNKWLDTTDSATLVNLEELVLQLNVSVLPLWRVYELPNLRKFSLLGAWSAASYISAPNLESLTLYGGMHNREKGNEKKLRRSTLQPTKLAITIGTYYTILEEGFIDLLRDKWNDLEELRIIYTSSASEFGEDAAIALLGTKSYPPVCPHLKKLEVLIPAPTSRNKMIARREQALARLRAIADVRRAAGILKCIRFGWYEEPLGIRLDDSEVDWSIVLK